VQRGEVAGDDRGRDHGDDGRRAPERERAGRASGHDGSFPGSSTTAARRGTGSGGRGEEARRGRREKESGDYDDLALDVDDSDFFLVLDDELSDFFVDESDDEEEVSDLDPESEDDDSDLSDLPELPLERLEPLRLSFL
jgi:hypothetical protein